MNFKNFKFSIVDEWLDPPDFEVCALVIFKRGCIVTVLKKSTRIIVIIIASFTLKFINSILYSHKISSLVDMRFMYVNYGRINTFNTGTLNYMFDRETKL